MAGALAWLFPLAVLFGAAAWATAAPETAGPAQAAVTYALGSAFDGRAAGTCDFGGATLAPDGGRLTIHSGGGAFDHHTYEATVTFATVPGWRTVEHVDAERLDVERTDIPAGRVDVEWPPGSRAHVRPLDLDARPGDRPMLAVDGGAYRVGPVGEAHEAFRFWEQRGSDVVATVAVPPPATRTFESPDALARVRGGIELYLEDATVRLESGRVHDLPADEGGAGGAEGAPAGREVRRVHYGFLRLEAADLSWVLGTSLVHCGGLDMDLDGTLVLFGARGRLGNEADDLHTVEEQVVEIEGRFAWSEAPAERRVDGRGTGDLRVASIDFRPLAPEDPLHTAATAGFAATIAAAALWGATHAGRLVAVLFTRLTLDDVLEHPRRRHLLEIVRARPHITLQQAAHASGLARPIARHHLAVLESRRLVQSTRLAGTRAFVAAARVGGTPGHAAAASEALQARDPLALAFVQALPPSAARLNPVVEDVARAFGVSRVAAWKAARRAEAYGLVSRQRAGREVWVRRIAASPA